MVAKLVISGSKKLKQSKISPTADILPVYFGVSEQLLNKIIGTVVDPIFVKDREHRWVVFNEAFCRFMGQTREKMSGKSDYDFFPKQEADIFWAKDELVFKSKKENINQEDFTDSKGVTHRIITKKNYYRDDKGNEFLVGIISDISEQKKLEESLFKQKKEQEMILDSIPAWVYYKDSKNNFIKVNKSFAAAMNKKKGEMEGRSLTNFYPKEQAKAFWQDDLEVINSGQPKNGIIESVKTPAGILWVKTDKIPHYDESGKIIGIIGFTIDITAQKNAEDALHQTTDRLLLATKAAGIGIWDYDVVNNKLVWDSQMYRLYGIKPDKFSGAYDAWHSGLHPDDMKRGDEEIQMALRGEKEFNTEFRVLWSNKNVRYIRAIALVERDKSGKPLRMVGTNWDITEIKMSEETLKEKMDELERLNKLMIGRELKMVELKSEIEKLK